MAIMDGDLVALGLSPKHALVDRPRTRRKLASLDDRAIILFTGLGGTGKTASLREWAKASVASRFGASRTPASVTAHWFSDQVESWRQIYGPRETPDAALSRLQIANATMAPPILFLAIDGIDERANVSRNTHELSQLISWFCAEDEKVRTGVKAAPAARLIVTCRRISDFEPYWIPNPSGSPMLKAEPPPDVPFDLFDDDEFAAVLQAERPLLGEALYSRLMRTTKTPIALPDEGSSTPDMATSVAIEAVTGTNESWLRQPAIWEAFISVGPEHREPFLEDRESGCTVVAQFLIERFLHKVVARTTDLDRDDVLLALARIASATLAEGADALTRARWSDVGGAALGHGGSPARRLFREALSAGFVEAQDGRWFWRYPFVARYLTRLDAGGAT